MNISVAGNMHLALSAVWTHRFRSLLTILGIVIGITTVVTVASLLTGLREGVVVFFKELGPDNIFLYKTSGDPSQDSRIPKERQRRAFKPEYADSLKRWCTSVEDVGLELLLPAAVDGNPITARVPGYESDTINVTGRSPNMEDIEPRDFAAGRFYTSEENQRSAHVAVIGASVAEALFPDGHGVGRAIMMDGAEYVVIGIYEKAKGGFFGENGMDNAIDIPLQTARSRYPQIDRFMITAKRTNDHPQVILLDLNLPKIDGLEVLRRVKADSRTRGIPVVVLTASKYDDAIAICKRLGAESFIAKPVDFQNFSSMTLDRK